MKTIIYDDSYEAYKKTSDAIKSFVDHNDYQIKGIYGAITEEQFNAAFKSASQRTQKRLAKYMWKVNNHTSLASTNLFLHFFMKTFLKSDLRIRIIKSHKELDIEAKRKTFREAREAMFKAKEAYQLEKGDFYKKKLSEKSQATA